MADGILTFLTTKRPKQTPNTQLHSVYKPFVSPWKQISIRGWILGSSKLVKQEAKVSHTPVCFLAPGSLPPVLTSAELLEPDLA